MHLKHRMLILSLFFSSSFFFSTQAQNAQITGQVFDPDDHPLSFANIALNNLSDSSLVKVEVTDEEGHFQMAGISAGSYWLEVTYVGLPPMAREVSLAKDEKKNLENLHMAAATGMDLAQVVVKAERPLLELKNDKMIFNVENSINATGSNGLELLRKAPGVVVDNNNSITMLGRSGVRIYINGKPSPLRGAELASYLESLQSTDIDAIEIITNPGSKYEAEGNAGIINIRMRKDKGLGANGNVNLGYAVGIRPQYTASISGNYRNKWMNAYGSYSINPGHWISFMELYRNQNNFWLNQRNDLYGSNRPQNFKTGVDFFLSEKSTLGILVDGGFNYSTSRVRARSALGINGRTTPDSLLLAGQEAESNRSNLNYNLNYQWQFKKDASLSIDANYGNFDFERREFQPNYYTDITEQTILSKNINETISPSEIQITALKVDYETALWGGTLGAGFKFAQVKTDNNFQFFRLLDQDREVDIDRTNRFIYDEKVDAAYFNYSGKVTKDVNFQLGLRMENTRSTGELIALKPSNNNLVHRSYLDWFPSASLNMNLTQDNLVQFSYSLRINRPSYESLNPFEWKLDELTFHRGNPFVQPEYSNIFQVRHSFKYKLNTTLSYSHTADKMVMQVDAGEGKVGYRTWLNLADQRDYSINIAAPVVITDWWSSFTSLTAYHRVNKGNYGEGRVIDISVDAFNLYAQQTFKIGEGFSLELSGFYNSPTLWQGSMQAFSQWSVDFGMKKQVLSGRGNLSVTLSDVFKTNTWGGNILFGAMDMEISGGWDSRRLRLNFSYLFGNNQVKNARNRKTGLDEEKKRTN